MIDISHFSIFICNCINNFPKIICNKPVNGREYKKEYEMLEISKCNKILHIGCGSYPLTEITLATFSSKEIVGIDKNQNAVKLAKEIIRKKKLDESITIHHGNGISFPVKEFDVIIISSCSTPMEKILENIFKKATKNSTIIVRVLDTTIDSIMNYIQKNFDITFVKRLHFKTYFFIPISWNALYIVNKKS
jgi:precorrin-6B methylase 2